MNPDEIEKQAKEVLANICLQELVNQEEFKEKFRSYMSPYMDKKGRIKYDDLAVVCTSFAIEKAVLISFQLNVELLKRFL